MGSAVNATAGELTLVPLGAEALGAGQAGIDAAALLQHVWNPPCLWNSADYIRWQFSMPGRLRSRGLGAYLGTQMVGFIGAVPRGVRVGDWVDEIWLMSFLAVAPEARGKGLAKRLLDEFVPQLEGWPLLAYSQPGSHAEGLMRATLAEQAYVMNTIGIARTYGGMLATPAASAATTIEPVSDHDAWLGVLGARPASADRLEAWPSDAEFAHYLTDARGRTFHAVRDAGGRALAGASAISAELRTAAGIIRQPTIELLALHEPDSNVLAAVVRQAPFSARSSADGATTAPVPVLAPNLLGIDEALLRPAALRATRSQWATHICYRGDHPLAAATQTNLEVV